MSNLKVSVQDGNNVTLQVTPQPRIDLRIDRGAVGPVGPMGPTGTGGALGLYGSFYDTTTQTLASLTAGQPVALNSTLEGNGVSIANGSEIVFSESGTYSLTFSIQFHNSNPQIQTARVWVRYNGVDFPDSASEFDVPESHGGHDGALIGTVNYVATAQNDNDVVQIFWVASSQDVTLAYHPSESSPDVPGVPSIILTATQVMYTQVGPKGDPGIYVGTSPPPDPEVGDLWLDSN